MHTRTHTHTLERTCKCTQGLKLACMETKHARVHLCTRKDDFHLEIQKVNLHVQEAVRVSGITIQGPRNANVNQSIGLEQKRNHTHRVHR